MTWPMTWTLVPAYMALAVAATAALVPERRAIWVAAIGLWTVVGAGVVLAALAISGLLPDRNGLAIVLVLLTSFVAAIVMSFSTRYLRADPRRRAYAVQVVLLAASVCAFVASRNVLLFAAAWLASGQLLAKLIGHVSDWQAAAYAERRASRSFTVGDTALLVALVMLALHAHTLDLAVMIAASASLGQPYVTLAALLILMAAMARSALPPFSGWLLGSMTAPTPVSALMHAGLVNAGGFVLIRFAPTIEAAPLVQVGAVAAGLIAALWGTGILLVRPDIKTGLAGSTIAQMGFMVLTCGLGGYAAALWHLVAHGLFKAWLFLGSGSAIGGLRAAALAPLRPAGVIVTIAASALAGIAMLAVGVPAPVALPLLLAIATGVVTATRVARGPGAGWLAIGAVGVVAVYAAGVTAIDTALARPLGVAPGGIWLPVIVAAIFLFCWAFQIRRQIIGVALPAALYVRLLNAGRFPGSA